MAVGADGRAAMAVSYGENMVMSAPTRSRGGRWGGGAVMVVTMAMRDDRRLRRMVAMARGRGGRGLHRMVMMAVMHQRKAPCGRQDDHSQGGHRDDPHYNSHHVFPYDARPGSRAARSQRCFNTMGTRPGKSSLTRPGPNRPAQAP